MGSLISESYREQNAALHALVPGYGVGGAKWAIEVRALIQNGETVLDYGCGKGELAKALWPRVIAEYDPAIEGKSIAKPADIVVCTDVLEHIEPEHLQDVLKHLASVTRKRMLFCIATVPSVKQLPDGRNPHLSLWPASWWKVQLEKYFNVTSWEEQKSCVIGLASPLHEMGSIQTISALSEDQRIENMRVNSRSVTKRLTENILAHDRRAVLCCSGPSLGKTWPIAANEWLEDSDLFTVSNAHDFLIEKGLMPTVHMDCDPRPHKHAMVTPDHHVKYWIASCVDPRYIAHLAGHDVTLWHLHNGPETQVAFFADEVFKPGEWLVVGGGSIGLRAISVLYSQGYRTISIHGMDCSYGDESHVAPHTGKVRDALDIRCGDRWFKSNLSLIDYARQFNDDMRLWPDAKITLHGDGLLQHMQRTGQ